MTGGVVCYVERELGGAVIRRVRLVAAGLSRSWTAPDAGALSSSAQPTEGPGAALSTTRLAASWITETLQSVGMRRLASICVDADGSVCAWLSAPSPDQTVIEASIMQAAQDAGAGDAAGLGAGRLLAMASPSGATGLAVVPDTSMQALATLDEVPSEEASQGKKLMGKSAAKPNAGAGRKHRFAVLAVPDAPVRVLLDELDQLGVEVDSVCSLWHAMAHAWDRAPAGSALDASGGATASVLVDPSGRLIWAWSSGGQLVAGGTMRLASIARASAEPVSEPPALDGSTRRMSESSQPPMLEFTSSEVGRLVMDWLAWSVQLGHCPRRVICLATPTLTDGAVEGAGALGRKLASAWPGATVDAGTYDDPIAATIARLAGLGNDDAPPARAPEAEMSARSVLMPLSARAGRADRSKFRWAAAGVLAGAVAVGAVGWQLGEAATKAQNDIELVKAERLEKIKSLEPVVPGISAERDPKGALETKVQKLSEEARQIRAPRPVVEETTRLLKALSTVQDVKLTEFDINAMFNAKAVLIVPSAETGPSVLEQLRSIPGVLPWTGTVPANFGSQTQRSYVLTGIWPTDDARGLGSGPVGAGGKK
jgi:hypothetical protein